MSPTPIEILAAALFAIAVAHTFLASRFQAFASRFPEGSAAENLFHLLGEVEVVFGIWAGVLLIGMTLISGRDAAIRYAESLNFTEPLFVLAIMAVAATRPVIAMARGLIFASAKALPIQRELATYAACLIIGPLLGSLITEPAAMTVTALILRERYFSASASNRLKYVTLAILFVNVSIGGVLTPFAAPPILMVAAKWNWGVSFMMTTFGWKAALAVVINAALATFFLRRELASIPAPSAASNAPGALVAPGSPYWMMAAHALFLAAIVFNAHHPVIFLGIFLFFVGFAAITSEHQDELRIRGSLLVAFFLAGLVVLGGMQSWWLAPAIQGLSDTALFIGAAALTAVTDNAALTFLGAQIEGVSDGFKYALVSGAVAGGGLTVIANAPNPAGHSILNDRFGVEGIRASWLLAAAIPPTLLAMACFALL